MKREERIQLESLSKLVYGSKSKYKKLSEKGQVTDLQETLEDGTIRKYKGLMYVTLEDIKKSMKEILSQRLENEKKTEQERLNKSESAKQALVTQAQELDMGYDTEVKIETETATSND